MKLRKTLALLLVLAMSVALIGCGSTAKAVDYQFILDACADWVADTDDLDALGTFMGGDYIGDELYTLMKMMVDEGFADMDDLTAGLDDELGVETGSEIKFSVQSEKDVDADTLADYQSDLDNASEALRDVADQLADLKELMDSSVAELSDDDLAELDAQFQEENGMSLDEYLELMNKMCESFNALADKLDGAKIDKAVTATITYKTDDGNAVEDIDFLKIGDCWANSYMIDMLKEMSSIA